jgi:hypothetical protein
VCSRGDRGMEPLDLSATPNGSLCSNDFIKFVSGLTEEQRPIAAPAHGQGSGLWSSHPVPGKNNRVSILQMNARMLPPENVEFVRQVIIGEAVYRFGIERARKTSAQEIRNATAALSKMSGTLFSRSNWRVIAS